VTPSATIRTGRHRFGFLLLAALLAWSASGCQVDLAAGLEVNRDGSGRVSAGVGLDAEAVSQAGDLSSALRVDDLRQAGWTVVGPRRENDGLTWVRATRPFTTAGEATATMAQLTGPEGPFKDFRLTRTRSLMRGRLNFTGVVDLTGGLSGLSDPDLAQRVGEVNLGLDLEGLRRRFGADLAKTVKVEVSAALPGKMTTNAPTRPGGRALWTPEVGQNVRLEASSDALNIPPGLVAAGAAALLMPLVAVPFAARRRRRRSR